MKHQYKQIGFDAVDYSFVHPSDLDEHNAYLGRLNKLIESPDRRYTTISYTDRPEITCPFCEKSHNYEVYNHMGFEWPSIVMHIMAVHNVTPDKKFLDSILRDTP